MGTVAWRSKHRKPPKGVVPGVGGEKSVSPSRAVGE